MTTPLSSPPSGQPLSLVRPQRSPGAAGQQRTLAHYFLGSGFRALGDRAGPLFGLGAVKFEPFTTGRYFTSGSRPKFPTRMTLFTEPGRFGACFAFASDFSRVMGFLYSPRSSKCDAKFWSASSVCGVAASSNFTAANAAPRLSLVLSHRPIVSYISRSDSVIASSGNLLSTDVDIWAARVRRVSAMSAVDLRDSESASACSARPWRLAQPASLLPGAEKLASNREMISAVNDLLFASAAASKPSFKASGIRKLTWGSFLAIFELSQHGACTK